MSLTDAGADGVGDPLIVRLGKWRSFDHSASPFRFPSSIETENVVWLACSPSARDRCKRPSTARRRNRLSRVSVRPPMAVRSVEADGDGRLAHEPERALGQGIGRGRIIAHKGLFERMSAVGLSGPFDRRGVPGRADTRVTAGGA